MLFLLLLYCLIWFIVFLWGLKNPNYSWNTYLNECVGETKQKTPIDTFRCIINNQYTISY
jgi:hypothetical protein